MANYQQLKAAIDQVIKANGQKEITGPVLNNTLKAIVNSLGANYQLAGVATPSTNPGTPDQNVFYIAGQAGTYANFGGIAIHDGVSVLKWNGSWSSETVFAGGVFDISAYKATGGTLATFADLSAALDGGNNVPDGLQKGGMSVKFVRSSDNKYVQYRLMAAAWSTVVTDWQGVDDVPTAGSDNLVKSGGVDGFVKVDEYVLENAVQWVPNLACVAGNNYIYQGDYYRCNYDVQSSTFVSWAFEKRTKGGFTLFKIQVGDDVKNITSNLIPIIAMVRGNSLLPSVKEGDVYFNTYNNQLYVCTEFITDPEHSEFVVMPFYDGAVYIYNNELYIWNGTSFELANLVKETIINVDSSGNGDYTSFVEAISSITSSDKHHRYVVKVQEGTYNIFSELTAIGWVYGGPSYPNNTEQYGLFIPDYTQIIGVGNKDNIILKGEFSDSEDATKVDAVSTINIAANVSIENVTISGKNCRYTIHCDFSKGTTYNAEITVLNSKFIHYGIAQVTTNNSPACWGVGFFTGQKYIFKNCEFTSYAYTAWLAHNRDVGSTYEISPASVEFVNCSFNNYLQATAQTNIRRKVGCMLISWGNNLQNNISFNGCSIPRGLLMYENADGKGLNYNVIGSGNNMPIIYYQAGSSIPRSSYCVKLDDEGCVCLNNSGSDIVMGKAVKIDANGNIEELQQGEESSFYGFAYQNIPNGTVGFVKSAGFILPEEVGVENVDGSTYSLNGSSLVKSENGIFVNKGGFINISAFNVNQVNGLSIKLEHDKTFDLANGIRLGGSTISSNIEASCLNDSSDDYYCGYSEVSKNGKRKRFTKRVVAINHDDMALLDCIAIRKLYNKYGFNANFNFILEPFSSIEDKKTRCENIKRLIADGNDIGLHAIFHSSYWLINRLLDCRIDLHSTFGPTPNEVRTVVADGKNIFRYTITENTLISQAGFNDVPSDYSGLKVLSMSDAQYYQCLCSYSIYASHLRGNLEGLDLEDNIVSKTALEWLEYWYNELIDNSLGYTSQPGGWISKRYYSDYDVPAGTEESTSAYNVYYPDASHLLSGKIVFFDDVTNPHYNDSEYQKVGRFNKGLFKGCASTRNCEVIGRIIDVVQAFCRHYFGLDTLTAYSRHGQAYESCYWYDSDGLPYLESSKTILAIGQDKFYDTLHQEFTTTANILISRNIKCGRIPYGNDQAIVEGENALYYGQSNIAYPYFSQMNIGRERMTYLELFGNSRGEQMSYETFLSYFGSVENWVKYTYEHAGETISNGQGQTATLYSDLKYMIDTINACEGTGKIPFLSLDTIGKNAGILAAVEMLFQYLTWKNIKVVPLEEARLLTTSFNNDRVNYFPNPNFTQSLLDYFGGISEKVDAYLPDGLFIDYRTGNGQSIEVIEDSVIGETRRVLHIDSDDLCYINASAYGLPAGTYRFSVYVKATNSARIDVYKKRNDSYVYSSVNGVTHTITPDSRLNPTSEWSLLSYEFTIKEPYHTYVSGSDQPLERATRGYQANIKRISIDFVLPSSSSLYISEPKIELI